jgi:hypothetical protein
VKINLFELCRTEGRPRHFQRSSQRFCPCGKFSEQQHQVTLRTKKWNHEATDCSWIRTAVMNGDWNNWRQATKEILGTWSRDENLKAQSNSIQWDGPCLLLSLPRSIGSLLLCKKNLINYSGRSLVEWLTKSAHIFSHQHSLLIRVHDPLSKRFGNLFPSDMPYAQMRKPKEQSCSWQSTVNKNTYEATMLLFSPLMSTLQTPFTQFFPISSWGWGLGSGSSVTRVTRTCAGPR